RSALGGECTQGTFCDPAAGVSAYPAAKPGALSEEHSAARSEYLPVLWSGVSKFRPDAGSRCATLQGRKVILGKPGSLLLSMQQQQGRSHAGRSGAKIGSTAQALYPTYLAAANAFDRTQRRALA